MSAAVPLNTLPPDSSLPFPHVLRVRASAGAGKTWILALRFTQFLLSNRIPHPLPEHILAVTFTRAATSIMRCRVLERLKKAALGDEDALRDLIPLVSRPAEAIPAAAERAADDLISRYDAFQVGTIDSLVHRFVRACAAELGLSPVFETDEHTEPYTLSATDRLIMGSGRDPRLWEEIKGFAVHFLEFEGKEGWWPRAILHNEFVRLLETESRSGWELRPGRPPRTSAIRMRLMRDAARFLALVDELGLLGDLKKNERTCVERIAAWDTSFLSSKILGKESAQDLFLRKKRAAVLPEEVERGWQGLTSLVGAYAAAVARERPLPYVRLFLRWKRELDAVKETRKVIFLSDMNLLARRLHPDLPAPEVLFRLGDRIRHVLVDEFQDTSALQWENLRPIIEEALSRGGSFFCVGDPKQTLYRWRGSDARIFDAGPEGFFSVPSENLLDLDLRHNWRSRRVILDFVASVFAPETIEAVPAITEDLGNDGTRRLHEAFTDAAQSVPPEKAQAHAGGFVFVEKTSALKDDPPWERLTRLLKEDILPRRRPGEVLVLLRRNEDVEAVTAALLAAGIPAVSERLLDIRSDPVVKEILSFLRFLDQPEDVHLAAVLAGRVAEDLWMRRSPAWLDPAGWIESVRIRRGETPSLSGALRKELPAFWDAFFLPFVRESGALPVYDIASRLAKHLEIMERFPESKPAMRRLLAVMHEKGPALGGDITAFLEWMDTAPDNALLLPRPEKAEAVQVMTIHKAKGLEAPVVVIPRAGLGPKAEGRILEEGRHGLRLWQTNDKLRNASKRLSQLHRKEREAAWRDELNVFYVALTRAREELFLLVPPKLGNNGINGFIGVMRHLAGDETDTFSLGERPAPRHAARGEGGEETASARRTEWRGKRPWEDLLVRREQAAGSPFLSPSRQRAVKAGETVHRLLARLVAPLSCPTDAGSVASVLDGMIEPWEKDGISPEDLERISRGILLPETQPLFWPEEGALIFTEKEIADEKGELFRIDRLVVTGHDVIACEYKTGGTPRDRDEEQLSRYVALLSAIHRGRSVSGLLLYLDTGLARRIPAP